MNIGVSIENGTLFLAADEGDCKNTSFHKSAIRLSNSDNEISSGYVWDQIEDEEFRNVFQGAEKIALSIPAGICYTKKISLERRLIKSEKDYRDWIAGKHLPGDLSKYIYGFIPLDESDMENKIAVLFYATLSDHFWPLFYAVIRDESYDRVCLMPEYTGLSFLLRKSLGPAGDIQGGMVNIGANGAAAVFIRSGRVISNRYFLRRVGETEDLKTDLETYLLSLMEPEEHADIFIAGKENLPVFDFEGDVSVKYNRMSAGFISALGSVEYISAGGKCELPADN